MDGIHSPISNTLISQAEDYVRNIFENAVPDKYVYHSLQHTLSVRSACLALADKADLTKDEKDILNLSALFHDVGFSRAYENHEDHSKDIAREFLLGQGVEQSKIERILGCIEATKVQNEPTTKLEMLIRDADMSSLGNQEYFDSAEKLRLELNDVKDQGLDQNTWGIINLQFLKDHKFYTEEAKELLGKGKKKNIKKLKKKLGLSDDEKVKPMNTIANSKSAQTQFKTSLRNHIDLSAIADNKANIMLSVNALIITIALPILGNNIRTNPSMLIPTIILLTVCVVSIIFATLATRPIKMRGQSTMLDIKEKKSNLFFFGNFFEMSFNDYEEGMQAVIRDDDILDNTIMRDLFFLGKALGRKYHYLRTCYNIFMFGIIASVLAFILTFIVTPPA